MTRSTAIAGDHQPLDKVPYAGPARRREATRTVQEVQAARDEKSAMAKKLAVGGAVSDRRAARPAVEAAAQAAPPAKEEIAPGTAAADRARTEGVEGGAVGGVLGGTEAPAEKDKKNAIMPAVEIVPQATRPAIRIAGDVSRADLSDPGLLDSWSWFPHGGVLRLEIDPAGAVVAVVPIGPWGDQAAARAQAAARELRFPAAAKKTRRAVLSASAPPN